MLLVLARAVVGITEKSITLAETQEECRTIAVNFKEAKARTDAMAAHIDDIAAVRQAVIEAKQAALEAKWQAREDERERIKAEEEALAAEQKAERDAQLKMDALMAAAKKAGNDFFVGMRVRVRPQRKRRFRATVGALLRDGPASDDAIVGKLVPQEEVQELENKYEEGISRIRTARGWCNAGGLVAIGAGSGIDAFTQTGTVVNIRVTPGADGAAPGIKVQLADGAQKYYEFADVIPYVHEVEGSKDSLGGPVADYEWEEGGLNGNPNSATERLVDGKGRGMLTYSVRRPASAAA